MLHDPTASFPSLGRKPSPSSSHLSAVLLVSCCPYFTIYLSFAPWSYVEGDSRGFFAYQVAVDGGSHLAVLGRLYLSTPVSFEPELGLTAAFYCTVCFFGCECCCDRLLVFQGLTVQVFRFLQKDDPSRVRTYDLRLSRTV